MNDFGNRLRRAREEVTMCVVTLSDETGIPVASLVALERNERPPAPHHIRLCARELGVSARYLRHGLRLAHSSSISSASPLP